MLNFLRKSYEKVRSSLGRNIRELLGRGEIDLNRLDRLEEVLYQSDLGVQAAVELTKEVRQLIHDRPGIRADTVIDHLESRIMQMMGDGTPTGEKKQMTVILVVGVNGNGKTTSVAKLSHAFRKEGQKVVIGAADTFRAAAIDQLKIWASRTGAEFVSHKPGADPSAVAYDAISAGLARQADKVLIDTAGRLHTKQDLMQELAKIRRVCDKVCPGAPHETLLVLDATTGQNAIEQAKIFNQYTPLTGLILTKVDGTARGGIVVAIQRELGLPVKYLGLGEGADDLQPFHAKEFARSLFA